MGGKVVNKYKYIKQVKPNELVIYKIGEGKILEALRITPTGEGDTIKIEIWDDKGVVSAYSGFSLFGVSSFRSFQKIPARELWDVIRGE